ncbi:MAG: DUF6174 domain-containing protein [Gemmatimonadota bacterium]
MALAVFGCSTSVFEGSQNSLAEANTRWHAAGVANYDFDFQRTCFCVTALTRPVTISVRSDTVVSVIYSDSGTVADSAEFRDFLTIDRVFAFLHRTLNQGPAGFTTAYHERYGFPALVVIDFDSDVEDDGLTLRIDALRPVDAAASRP